MAEAYYYLNSLSCLTLNINLGTVSSDKFFYPYHLMKTFVNISGVPGFLKLFLCECVCMFVCVHVYPPSRLLINSGVMWCDINPRVIG